MKRKLLNLLLMLTLGVSGAWAETVGTADAGDAWASRKHSQAYEVKLGETRHFTFTNTSYGSNVWNNYLVECTDGTGDYSVSGEVASTYYFTLRADNYGWGDFYDGTTFATDMTDIKAALDGATVDLSVNFNEADKKVRTYAIITNNGKTYYRYNTSKAINQSSVFISLAEELAVLEITKNELIEMPLVYSRTATADQTNTWTNDDLTDWNASSAVSINATKGLYAYGRTTETYVNKSFAIEDNAKVKYALTWVFGGAPGANSGKTSWNYAWIQFGDKLRIGRCQWAGNYSTVISVDGGVTYSNANNLYVGDKNSQTKDIEVVFNTATKAIESFKFGGVDFTSSVSSVEIDPKNTSIKTGFTKNTTVNWDTDNAIKNITVTQSPQVVAEVDYEIHYQLSGNDVLVVSGSEAEGNVIATQRQITGNIGSYDGQQYFVIANELPSLTLSTTAGNPNVLNVPVRVPNTYTMNVKAVGGVSKTIHENVAVTEGDTYTFAIPAYIIDNNKAYKANVGYYNRRTVTPTESGDVEITYNKVYDNVVKYIDLDVAQIRWSDADLGMQSNGLARDNTKFPNTEEEKIILAPGIYTIVANVYYRGRSCHLYVGENELKDISTLTKNSWNEVVVENVVITENDADNYIKLVSDGKTYEPLDYVFAVKTADLPSTVNITIGSYGYATYVTPYNMDFTDSKITAYAVSSNIENDMVTITPVDGQKVPAGTALVLKGETDDINVTAEAVGAVDTDLTYSDVAITDATKDAGKTYYYLGVENGTVVFRPLAAGGTLVAGKCFFTVDASAGAKSLRIAFDNDNTTGAAVTEANAVKANGKYVENGQIVIINNGKKYNVVGIMK